MRHVFLSGIGILAMTAWSPAEIVTLSATQDATLIEHPDGILANGAGQHFHAGRTNQQEMFRRRGLLAFDVAKQIPPDSIIIRAGLLLHLSQSQPGEHLVTVYRATTPWTEGTSDPPGKMEGAGDISTLNDPTWIHSSYDTEFWQSPGGDYDATIGARTWVSSTGGFHLWSSPVLVAQVQDWLNDPGSNHGWLLLGDEARQGSSKRFDSRQHPDPAMRPRLVVHYEALGALDVDGDGHIAAPDLALLLAAWGPVAADHQADLDRNRRVDAADLAILLAAWK